MHHPQAHCAKAFYSEVGQVSCQLVPIGDFRVVQRLDIWIRPLRQNQLLVWLSPPLCSEVSVFVLHRTISFQRGFDSQEKLRFTYQCEVGCVLPDVPIQRLATIPIQIPEPLTQSRIIISDHLQVTHEDVHIRNIKPDQSRVEPDVRLGDILAKEIR